MENTLKLNVELKEIWATPREGMSVYGLTKEMHKIGNTVLEIDEANNRLRLQHNG